MSLHFSLSSVPGKCHLPCSFELIYFGLFIFVLLCNISSFGIKSSRAIHVFQVFGVFQVLSHCDIACDYYLSMLNNIFKDLFYVCLAGLYLCDLCVYSACVWHVGAENQNQVSSYPVIITTEKSLQLEE